MADKYDIAKGLRRSDLWLIHKSPAHFKQHINDTKDATPALLFGIACHMAILEPGQFQKTYRVIPDINKRTKAGKEEWARFQEECEQNNQYAISKDDHDTILQMQSALLSDPLAANLINGQHESEWYWTDPETGIDLKCKCDIITKYNGKKYIIDYKTTDSCEDGHFERSVRKYGYQFQAGFYTSGIELLTGESYGFGFIAQEKKPPYACRVYLCSDLFVEKGKDQFKDLLNRYKYCRDTDNWYGYEGIIPEPVILMDYNEKKNNEMKGNIETPTYRGFRSDDYLEENPWDDV